MDDDDAMDHAPAEKRAPRKPPPVEVGPPAPPAAEAAPPDQPEPEGAPPAPAPGLAEAVPPAQPEPGGAPPAPAPVFSSSSSSSSDSDSSSGSDPPQARVARAARSIPFGPFDIAPVVRQTLTVGWGATCGLHLDSADHAKACCKKQLAFSSMSEVECRSRIKLWLLKGLEIDPHSEDQRTTHRETRPQDLELIPEADIDAQIPAAIKRAKRIRKELAKRCVVVRK
jgi:hypothetical protein